MARTPQTQWVCPKCGWKTWQPPAVLAMSHPCGKGVNSKQVALKKVKK